ncbi:hypothetical protein EDB19DRAFT_1828384 [Suillus lakei]|nr:hypothetical protein EDB19DRAFT_1828384 [Suillus lakei]
MAAEGNRAKQKATDKPSIPAVTSKCMKFTASVNLEQTMSNTTSSPNYHATVRSEEEEEALHTDTIVIDSDASEKSDIEDLGGASDDELKWLMKDWTSPIYAFFEPTPGIEYHDGRCCHMFKCTVRGCKHCVRRYLDKKDVKSTGNMHKHVKPCWGEAALQAAMECQNTAAA